ncbi:MAG: glycoside hydrolase family 15 protein [Acidobacteriota bacterium]|nr:glycoside hydrolase family 15 protein [Acidobacteriota bacterium]
MRHLVLGNGSLLISFDEKYQIRDIFYPHAGQENHTKGYPSRFGVWADGNFSWIFSDNWIRLLDYLPKTFVTNVQLENHNLGIRIKSNDTIFPSKNIFIRKISLESTKKIRLFLHQDFRIFSSKVGDCAFYEPQTRSIIHYKKNRYFLIASSPSFCSFAIGRKAFSNLEGTWRDAEDGELHQTAIAEGSVDSTIRIDPDSQQVYYWICAGSSLEEVIALQHFILSETPSATFEFSKKYWSNWLIKPEEIEDLSSQVSRLYERSLFVIRAHTDKQGAVIASSDSEVTERASDHYAYLWTRDGAFTAYALDLAGYSTLTKHFFQFCSEIVHEKGYFLQRYNADGTPASSWHPLWDVNLKKPLTPIQEDETALILWALGKHYEKYKDTEFIAEIYQPLIVRCADFMVKFRNEKLKLPDVSWNLWEDRCGIHAFTTASVIAGLKAASTFAEIFGDTKRAKIYDQAANYFREGMLENLYCHEAKRFLRSIEALDNGGFTKDYKSDASLLWLTLFGIFDSEDEKIKQTVQAIEENLWNKTQIGGLSRYENDLYMKTSEKTTGNPWIICTLWLADYYILSAKTKSEIEKARSLIEKVASWASESGMLPEQISPFDRTPISVMPLTWSHACFIATVNHLIEKIRLL